MFVGEPWNPRSLIADSPGGIRDRYITRSLVQEQGATDVCAACQGAMCQGVENGLRTSSIERNSWVQWCNKKSWDEWLMRPPVDHPAQVEQEPPQQHASIPEPIAIPPQPSSSSREDPMQVNRTVGRARIPEDEDDTRTKSPPTFGHECVGQ